MKTIRLYGELGRLFGREHRLDVKSPQEAVRALCANFPAMRRHLLTERAMHPYYVWAGTERRTRETYGNPCADREIIRIAPVVAGAGGFFDFLGIILGAALILVAPQIGIPFLATAASSVGWGLVLGGVSSLLFSPPDTQSNTQDQTNTPIENKPSFIFDGPVNVIREGGCVPVCYGRMEIGSTVISAGLFVAQL